MLVRSIIDHKSIRCSSPKSLAVEIDNLAMNDFPVSDFSSEYNRKVERVLASSYRSIGLALTDYYLYDGIAFRQKQVRIYLQ